MANSLLGLGLFALVAAIVGGGLKAFGFEVGVLRSLRRQIALGGLGLILIVAANPDAIREIVFPTKFVTKTIGPIELQPGRTHSIPMSLTRRGAVNIAIESLVQDWNSFSGQKGLPGQDGLYVSICSAVSTGPCPRRQMGVSEAFSQELPAGSGTISLFNFAMSPKVTFTARFRHPA
jgi:hypothetical protein